MDRMEQHVRPEQKKGLPLWLRNDLGLLTEYLGKESLAEGLVTHDCRRILEVGVGNIEEGYDAIMQLLQLEHNGKPIVANPDNLLAVDPEIDGEETLEYITKLQPFLNRFKRRKTSVEAVAKDVGELAVPAFDLVIARGVASIGNLLGVNSDIRQVRSNGLMIIDAMKSCLHNNSQKGFLLISTKNFDTVLPFWRGDFEKLGMQIVVYEEADGNRAEAWIETMQNMGIFPKSKEIFYRTTICKRK